MGAPWTRGTTVLTPRKEMVLNTGSHLGRWEVMGTGVLAAGRGSAARGSAPWRLPEPRPRERQLPPCSVVQRLGKRFTFRGRLCAA